MLLLLIILILLFGGGGYYGYSNGYYGPSGVGLLWTILVIVLILCLLGVLRI